MEGRKSDEMKIKVDSRDFSRTVEFKGKNIGELLKKLKLNPENFVLSKNNEIVLEDEKSSSYLYFD